MRIPFLLPLWNRLQRLLKLDLKYAVSGGFFLGLTQVTSAVGALGLTIAFANLLPIETYGTYRYVLAVYALLAIASLPGIDTAVSQSVARGYDSALVTGIRTRIRWGLLGTLASFLYAGYLYLQGSFVMGHIFMMVGVALPFMESLSLYASFLNAKKFFRTSAIIDICTQAISVVSLVIAMFITKNIVVLMSAYFIPYIIIRALSTWFITNRLAKKSENDPGFLSYGRSMTLFQIISRLIASADQIVLYHFLGPAQVAIFSLATAIPNRLQSVFRITGTLAFPKFAKRTGKEVADSLPYKMLLFFVGILAVCLVYVLLAPLLFTYVFPQYLPALLYSQAGIFYTLSAITYPFGAYLMAHKKIRDTYIIALGGFLTKIICLVGLVPFFGIWGAIVGILATSAVSVVLTLWMIVRERASTDNESPYQSPHADAV